MRQKSQVLQLHAQCEKLFPLFCIQNFSMCLADAESYGQLFADYQAIIGRLPIIYIGNGQLIIY